MRNIESNILRYKRNEIKAYIWSKGIAGVLISDTTVVFGNEACLSRRRTHLSLSGSNYKRKQQHQLCCVRVLCYYRFDCCCRILISAIAIGAHTSVDQIHTLKEHIESFIKTLQFKSKTTITLEENRGTLFKKSVTNS